MIQVLLVSCHVLRLSAADVSNVSDKQLHGPVTGQQELVSWQWDEVSPYCVSTVEKHESVKIH